MENPSNFFFFTLHFQAAEEELKESGPNPVTVQTSSTPTPSETTEVQPPSPPEREPDMSTESTAFDAVDTGSAVESQEAKNEDDNISGLEGDNNKADNDVDEGVDLQGRAHFLCILLNAG